MGVHDSSRTRVAPVFDRLFAIDPTGASWLPGLLGLVNAPPPTSNLIEARWWPTEKCLFPPLGLLEWLAENLQKPARSDVWQQSPGTAERWKRLIDRDPQTISEALAALRAGQRYGGWHVLEGPSYPDAYLGTEDTLIVIEGKRTERGPTRDTTWKRDRHQILRHLDGAFEVLRGRRLLGLIIVESAEGGGPPPLWNDYLEKEVRSEAVLLTSVPHRTAEQRQAICAALLGVITWQSLCARLNIPAEVLLSEVCLVESDALAVRTRGLKEEAGKRKGGGS